MPKDTEKQKRVEKKAMLDHGAIVDYDINSRDRTAVVSGGFYDYLGCGTIFTINGYRSNDATRYHFWKAKEKA